MNTATLLALLHCDDDARQWFVDAADSGWSGLDEIADAMLVSGKLEGHLRCGHCDTPLVDETVFYEPDSNPVRLLSDQLLCPDCYEAVKEARQKIVVHVHRDDEGEAVGYEEDRSGLTDEEAELAEYLDDNERAANRDERNLTRPIYHDGSPHFYEQPAQAELGVFPACPSCGDLDIYREGPEPCGDRHITLHVCCNLCGWVGREVYQLVDCEP